MCIFEQKIFSVMLFTAWPMPSCGVCSSVCLSVTFVYCIKMSKHILKLPSPSGGTILVFHYQTFQLYFDRDPSNGDVESRCSMKNRYFRSIYHFISEMIQDGAIVTIKHQWEHVCDLSNGAISNDP